MEKIFIDQSYVQVMNTVLFQLSKRLFVPFAVVIIILSCICLIEELLPEVHAKPIVMTTLVLTIIVALLGLSVIGGTSK